MFLDVVRFLLHGVHPSITVIVAAMYMLIQDRNNNSKIVS